MPTLGVCCFSSCRLLIGPSTSAWVFLRGGICRFKYLEQTLRRCHRLFAAHTRTMTVVSSSGKCLLFLCAPFPNGNISDVVFSSFSLYPSQHIHFCCVNLVLFTFSYRPTFPTIICHCGSNCRFVDIVLQYFWDVLVLLATSCSHPPSDCIVEPK